MKKHISSRLCRWLAASLCLAVLPMSANAVEKQPTFTRLDVSTVWSGHPVGFALLTNGDRQYVGYYDADRNMVVASRKLDSDQWTKQILPTKVVWDSHNYITMAVDRDGQLHVAGNMHVCPIIYFRTEKAGDVTTLKRIEKMTGERESSMTYPQFIAGNGGEMIYTYRDGASGKGDTLYNKYDEKTQTWTRLLDQPLFDGHGKMNAYPAGPLRGPDGYWHVSWVWRDKYLAETNHDLSYIRSKDLVHWETAEGKPLTIPISLETPGVIVDPIPVNGGIINGCGQMGFDDKNRVVLSYHKFDKDGATQAYLTRFEDGKWNSRQITNWTYRWEFSGGGCIQNEVGVSPLRHNDKIGYFIGLSNAKHGNGSWKVDPGTLQLGEKLPGDVVPGKLPSELHKLSQNADPNLRVQFANDRGEAPKGTRYVLRWETLPVNRDLPQTCPIPAPSQLQLIKITEAEVSK